MTTRFLACYVSGMLALIAMLLSLVTYVPEAQLVGFVVQGVCWVLAGGFAVLGSFSGQLAPQHWVNRSLVLRGALFVLAAVITLFLLLCLGLAEALSILVKRIF
jgi:hypothetical protein